MTDIRSKRDILVLHTKLSDVKLRTGEKMETGVVVTPDEDYAR